MSTKRPTLSIILTNYNHARFLPRALDAIVHQSVAPDELILVDDSSTDYSLAVMRHYANRYPFIKVHPCERNLGVTGATNAGMQSATGDFVQRIAADDFLLPGAVETLLGLAEKWPDAGIACAPLTYIAEWQDTDWSTTPQPRPDCGTIELGWAPGFHTPTEYSHLLEHGPLSSMSSLGPSTIFRTNLVRSFGGWPAELGMHEVSFILRACGLHSGVSYATKPIYMWIVRNSGLTAGEIADSEKWRGYLVAQAERMQSPQFAHLFSDCFRARWDKESAQLFAPPVVVEAPRRSVWAGIRQNIRDAVGW